ncbi:MAG: O-antigen ligase family protein [Candidatus Binatia bacterium]
MFLTIRGNEIFGLLAILLALGAIAIFVRPEIGILLFLTSFFATYGDSIPTSGRLTPNNLLGLFFSVLLVIKVYQERNLSFLKDRIFQIFLVIVLFFHFSSPIVERQLFNPFPQFDATGRMLHDVTARFVFLVFFINFIRTLRDVKLVLWTVLGIIFLSGVSGVVNAFTGAGFGIGGYRAAADWGISSAGNANRLAFYCVLGIALSWYYKRVVRNRILSLFLTAAIPGLAIAALTTASRSGLLNLFVVCGLLAMEGRFSVKRQLNLVIITGLVVFLASDFLSETHIERLGNIPLWSSSETKGTSSTEKRLKTLSDGSKIIVDNPILGAGIGNFRWVRLERFGAAGPPHNSYLWAAAEGGVPILLLYLLLFGLALKNLLRAESKSTSLEARFIARGLRTGLMSFLFFSLFADFWLNIMTYVLVGLAIVLGRLQAEELNGNFAVRANYQALRA